MGTKFHQNTGSRTFPAALLIAKTRYIVTETRNKLDTDQGYNGPQIRLYSYNGALDNNKNEGTAGQGHGKNESHKRNAEWRSSYCMTPRVSEPRLVSSNNVHNWKGHPGSFWEIWLICVVFAQQSIKAKIHQAICLKCLYFLPQWSMKTVPIWNHLERRFFFSVCQVLR